MSEKETPSQIRQHFEQKIADLRTKEASQFQEGSGWHPHYDGRYGYEANAWQDALNYLYAYGYTD
jgi:hypothetical protein